MGAGGRRPLIVCAPNAFKGTLTAVEAAAAMARGVRRALPGAAAVEVPVADGGDGTLDVLLRAAGAGARVDAHRATGPLGVPVAARLGWTGPERAVVELAEASGLRLLGATGLDALAATSRGVGDLLRAALGGGARHVVVGAGGSACTDGGAGLLAALGLRVLDGAGAEVGPGGGGLAAVARVDATGLDPWLAAARIEVAADTRATLSGPDGAARLYGPQKGASAEDVEALDAALQRWAGVLEADLGVDPAHRDSPGAGAAGGAAYGLAAVAGASIVAGAALVCDAAGLDAALRDADLVLTGEGRLDPTTATGKAPHEVALRAAAAGVPCVAIVGSVSGDPDRLFAAVAVLPRADPSGSPRGWQDALAEAAASAVSAWSA